MPIGLRGIDCLKNGVSSTRWGSCNQESKKIHLNLELAKKPLQCLEYIIVHEMVHLLERKHGERFLAYMNKYLSNWKAYKEELSRLPIASYFSN